MPIQDPVVKAWSDNAQNYLAVSKRLQAEIDAAIKKANPGPPVSLAPLWKTVAKRQRRQIKILHAALKAQQAALNTLPGEAPK
jgi:hypothetical protein